MNAKRIAVLGATVVALLGLAAGPAEAHVTNDNAEVAAGSTADITLTVPHGCDGAPTSAISVQIPEDVVGVTPQVHPGWDVAVETETLPAPVDLGEGETVTERARVVTFTAQPGNELPDGFRDQFTLGYVAPDTPGEYLFFKTIQTCTGGVETAWIEEYTGEGEEPEHPSPVVLLTESTGEEHGDETTETTEAEETGTTEAGAETTTDSNSDDDGPDGFAIAALLVGVLALAVGGAAFAGSRRS